MKRSFPSRTAARQCLPDSVSCEAAGLAAAAVPAVCCPERWARALWAALAPGRLPAGLRDGPPSPRPCGKALLASGWCWSCSPGAQAPGAGPASPRGSGCREAAALPGLAPLPAHGGAPAVQGGQGRARPWLSSSPSCSHPVWPRLRTLPETPIRTLFSPSRTGRFHHPLGGRTGGRRLGHGAASAKPHTGRSPGGPARPGQRAPTAPSAREGVRAGRGGLGGGGRACRAWRPSHPRVGTGCWRLPRGLEPPEGLADAEGAQEKCHVRRQPRGAWRETRAPSGGRAAREPRVRPEALLEAQAGRSLSPRSRGRRVRPGSLWCGPASPCLLLFRCCASSPWQVQHLPSLRAMLGRGAHLAGQKALGDRVVPLRLSSAAPSGDLQPKAEVTGGACATHRGAPELGGGGGSSGVPWGTARRGARAAAEGERA